MIISRRRRIGYGAAELGVSGTEVMLRVSLLIYYTQVVGMRPDLASYAIALGIVWDAVTDPIMGRISDHACIYGQKRRPFFLPAGIGLAIFLVLVFNVPTFESQISKFIYLLVTYLGTNTFLTILSVPHTALAADLGQTQKVRMELFGWRLIFANIGLIIGTVAPALLILWGITSLSPDGAASLFMGAVIIIGVVMTLLSTRNMDKSNKTNLNQNHTLESYLSEFGHVLQNRAFAWLLVAYMVATIGLTLNSSFALYYYQYFLKLDDVVVRGIIAFFMIIFCLSIPLWIWATRYFSKASIIMVNVLLLGLMTIFGYPNFPPGLAIWPLIAALFGGVFVGAVVLMDVAVADLADQQAEQDRKNTSSNHGMYFGFWKMGAKLSRAIALILTGNALAWIGFEAGEVPNDKTAYLLSLLFGPGVGVFLLAAVGIIYFALRKGVAHD